MTNSNGHTDRNGTSEPRTWSKADLARLKKTLQAEMSRPDGVITTAELRAKTAEQNFARSLLYEAYCLFGGISSGRRMFPSEAELEARPDFYLTLELVADKRNRSNPDATPLAPLVRRKRRSLVYFLHAEGTSFVKIGTSDNFRSRFSGFQVGCAFPLKLLGTHSGGAATERELHERFSHLRQRGEWFRLEPDLQQFIDGLAAESK